MSPLQALAAHTQWQTPTCLQGLVNLAFGITKGRRAEATKFNLPHVTLAWRLSKAAGGLYQCGGDPLLLSATLLGEAHPLRHWQGVCLQSIGSLAYAPMIIGSFSEGRQAIQRSL